MGLDEYREEIDDIDARIMELLKERFVIIESIAGLKKERGRDIFDGDRERDIRRRWRRVLDELDPDFVDALVGLILEESKRVQERVR